MIRVTSTKSFNAPGFSLISRFVVFATLLLTCLNPIYSQIGKNKKRPFRSILSSLPSGYSQVGTTQLYTSIVSDYYNSYTIDVMGKYQEKYYGSTYSNMGYRVAMKVNDNEAEYLDCKNGQELNGVKFSCTVTQQGELARISYIVTNTNSEEVTLSLGTHADVQIGDNDRAPLSIRKDTYNNSYGINMKDGNGAQLCVLFGSGLSGVTPVSDFWFGQYNANSSPYEMVGNYQQSYYWMEENGSYDSVMGWCWKNRKLAAGDTTTFSYLIGVGEVDLSPKSDFVATPEDPISWNNIEIPHLITLEGTYESPAGVDGKIEYSIEDNSEWHALTELLPSGTTFKNDLVAVFNPEKKIHTINFRTIDNVGNASLLPPIEYIDINHVDFTGIEDLIYNGTEQIQEHISASLQEGQYSCEYTSNKDAGEASLIISGVFPYTIGYKHFNFNIQPCPLSGYITIKDNNITYTGNKLFPAWTFSDEALSSLLLESKDYKVSYSDNLKPGTGRIIVEGIGNYTGRLENTFTINKASFSDELVRFVMPEEDICYDGQEHTATANTMEGVGECTFTYTLHNDSNPLEATPKEEGQYDVYVEIAEGDYYYGIQKKYLGSFSIYQFNDEEWKMLTLIANQLNESGMVEPWDTGQGKKAVTTFKGLKIKEGHVIEIDLHERNLKGELPKSIFSFPHIIEIDLSNNQLTDSISDSFVATSESLEVLNLSKNELKGNVGQLASRFKNLTALNVSNNNFSEISPAISKKVINLDYSQQEINKVLEYNYSKMSVRDFFEKVPSLLLYNHKNNKQDENLVFYLYKVNDKNAIENSPYMVLDIGQDYASFMMTQTNYFETQNGALLVGKVLDKYNKEKTICSIKFKLSFDMGDCDYESGVTINDLQATILYCFNDLEAQAFNATAADTYTDGIINVQDVVATANIILDQDAEVEISSKTATMSMQKLSKNNNEATCAIYNKNGKVILVVNEPIAALNIQASQPTNWNLVGLGLTQVEKGNKVVAYSLSSHLIPIGVYEIGTCPADSRILKADLSNEHAKPVKVNINSNVATQIAVPIVDRDNEHDNLLYNISGQRVGKDHKGIVIVKSHTNHFKRINQ